MYAIIIVRLDGSVFDFLSPIHVSVCEKPTSDETADLLSVIGLPPPTSVRPASVQAPNWRPLRTLVFRLENSKRSCGATHPFEWRFSHGRRVGRNLRGFFRKGTFVPARAAYNSAIFDYDVTGIFYFFSRNTYAGSNLIAATGSFPPRRRRAERRCPGNVMMNNEIMGRRRWEKNVPGKCRGNNKNGGRYNNKILRVERGADVIRVKVIRNNFLTWVFGPV